MLRAGPPHLLKHATPFEQDTIGFCILPNEGPSFGQRRSLASRFRTVTSAPTNPTKQESGAFTLVEIVLAIGIIAFAFVALLGMLPVGLGVFHSGMTATIRSQLAQRVITDVAQTDYSILSARGASLPDRYFDNDGIEVAQAASVYTARTLIAPAALPPATTAAGASDNLLTLKIQIASNPAHAKDPFVAGAGLEVVSYVTFVACNDGTIVAHNN